MVKSKWTDSGRRRIRKRLKNFTEEASGVYHYTTDKDTEIIKFVAMPAIALHWPTENPLWAQVIGAPGSGKTAHIELLNGWHKTKMVSRLTENSLISGYRSEDDPDNDPSFLNELDGKLLIIKDFTTILQSRERDSVIGQLRDIFDGTASRVFGNIGLQEYSSKFNMLLAVTNVIDGYHSVNQQLGERFISRREYGRGRKHITSVAFDNVIQGRNKTKLDNLKNSFQTMVDRIPEVPIASVQWSSKMRKRAISGADFISRCRSHVTRERDGRAIAGRPSPEVGGRLVTQIVQCVAAHSIVSGFEEVKMGAWKFGGAKILRDTLPAAITWTLFHVTECRKVARTEKAKWSTIKDLMKLTKLGWNTVEQITTNLYHNGILDCKYHGITGRRNTEYKVNDYAYDIINNTKLFTDYSDDEIDIKSLRAQVKSKERKRKLKK